MSQPPFHSLNVGMSTSDDPTSVRENRRRLVAAAGLDGSTVLPARLVHGSRVLTFKAAQVEEMPVDEVGGTEALQRADAVVSDVPGLAFLLTVADCVPLLFLDTRTGAVGAAHAGWRGTAQGIAGEVVRVMQRDLGSRPRDLVAAIGPSIGPCCYTVGQNVVTMFEEHGTAPVLVGGEAARRLDLWLTNQLQLEAAGVDGSAIDVSGICTACHVDRFFSHRKEQGLTGRLGVLIGRPANRS